MFSFDVVVLLACFIACRALTDDEISKFTSAVTITTSNGNTTITTRTGEPDHDTTEDTCTIRTSILPLEESWTMAQNPTRLSQQANLCLPMGTIGIGINGVRMYSPFNKEIENAVEGTVHAQHVMIKTIIPSILFHLLGLNYFHLPGLNNCHLLGI